jgi:putative Mg2+ transporter-C (MgtC) family protein
MMVALGAALFTLTGLAVVGDDSRAELVHVIQGLATGIGFIGAGTILKLTDRLEILGLTTASSIWLAAAVGTACGLRHYTMAAVAAVLSLIILAVLGQLEKLLHSGGTGTSRHDESATSGKVNDVPMHQSSSKQLSA